MKGFKGVNAYIEGKGLVRTDIAFRNGRIAVGGAVTETVMEVPDDALVLPGFIDQHIHGADNFDAMDGTAEALIKIANCLPREGTVAFLATTMTQSPSNISKALSAIKDYRATKSENGAEILGVHLEGPFISEKHIGAQPLEYVAAPDVEIFKQYEAASGDSIRIVSLAPEVPGSDALIRYLVSRGIVVSLGHTDATFSDVERAVSFGASNITHTYNAMRALHHREAGTVGSAMLIDSLNCELICDGIHVSVPAMRLVVKNKPHSKLTLITDAMRAKGLADGCESELGGQKVFVKNGEARLASGALAGSVLKMNDAVRNAALKVGVPLLDAVDFASINPARNLGIDADYGSVADGKLANFAVLSSALDVLATVRGGKLIFLK